MSVPTQTLPPEGRAALRGGVLGNYVDQVHIFLPLLALAPALPTLAGPHAGAATGGLVVMAMLLGRPVGGIVFGRVADRWGRTRTTRLAITGTAACTGGIALVPPHEVVGSLAIALVLLLRLLGGIFIAGEYSAAIPLAMEWSRPRRRGLVSGLIMSMAPLAQASIAFTALAMLVGLGDDRYAAWGWRVPFVVGALASVGMLLYYRRLVTDSPTFHRSRRDTPAAAAPGLRDLILGRHAGAFWRMFGLMSGLWCLTNVTVILLAGVLAARLGLAPRQVSVVMGVAALGQAVVMAVTGQLSSVLGRRRFFVVWGLLAAVAGPMLWLWLMPGSAPWSLSVGGDAGGGAAAAGAAGAAGAGAVSPGLLAAVAVGAVALQVVTVCAYGPVGAYLSEGFPTAVRSTGYGTAYSLSIVIPALHPFYLPALGRLVGPDVAVVGFLALGGALVAGCAALGPALTPHDLDTVASEPTVGSRGAAEVDAAGMSPSARRG